MNYTDREKLEIKRLRFILLEKYPEIFQEGTVENKAFVAYAKLYGEINAHHKADILMELARSEALIPNPKLTPQPRKLPLIDTIEPVAGGRLLQSTAINAEKSAGYTELSPFDAAERNSHGMCIVWNTIDPGILCALHEHVRNTAQSQGMDGMWKAWREWLAQGSNPGIALWGAQLAGYILLVNFHPTADS